MNKVYASASAALDGLLRDGMTLAVGGFGVVGTPDALIRAVRDANVGNLTVISNNAGLDVRMSEEQPGIGLAILLLERRIRKMIASYVGDNREFERQYLAGELEVEFTPQGTLAEKMRAGGAGIPAFYTRTGYGTKIAEGKETRQFKGEWYVLEESLTADLSLVKAWKADRQGNLIYRKTARNFNPVFATGGKACIAEVEHIVENGVLDPDAIHTPGIYVDRLVLNTNPMRLVESRLVRY